MEVCNEEGVKEVCNGGERIQLCGNIQLTAPYLFHNVLTLRRWKPLGGFDDVKVKMYQVDISVHYPDLCHDDAISKWTNKL